MRIDLSARRKVLFWNFTFLTLFAFHKAVPDISVTISGIKKVNIVICKDDHLGNIDNMASLLRVTNYTNLSTYQDSLYYASSAPWSENSTCSGLSIEVCIGVWSLPITHCRYTSKVGLCCASTSFKFLRESTKWQTNAQSINESQTSLRRKKHFEQDQGNDSIITRESFVDKSPFKRPLKLALLNVASTTQKQWSQIYLLVLHLLHCVCLHFWNKYNWKPQHNILCQRFRLC